MFVAITKKVGDLGETPGVHKGKNAAYPLECVQGDNLEHLQLMYPESKTMTVEAYAGYKHAMNEVYENQPVVLKKWWKFWA